MSSNIAQKRVSKLFHKVACMNTVHSATLPGVTQAYSEEINSAKNSQTNLVTRDAAHLSMVEFALGSLLHALHFPFTGHLLSINEGLFLSHASVHSADRRAAALACYEIAGVAATIKSFSPTGKKLGPMLGIIMQGLLFSLGILIFGKKKLGQFVGIILLSVWAFIHPLLSLVITFGFSQISEVARFYLERLNLDYHVAGYTVVAVILTLYTLKIVIAFIAINWLNQSDDSQWQLWQTNLIQRSHNIISQKKVATVLTPLKGSLTDLSNPLFLFSFVLTWIFLFAQKSSWSEFIGLALRPVGLAFVIFYLLRSPEFLKLCSYLAQRFGILKPIHRRLVLVQHYLNLKTSTTSTNPAKLSK